MDNYYWIGGTRQTSFEQTETEPDGGAKAGMFTKDSEVR